MLRRNVCQHAGSFINPHARRVGAAFQAATGPGFDPFTRADGALDLAMDDNDRGGDIAFDDGARLDDQKAVSGDVAFDMR